MLTDSGVSNVHARVLWREGRWWVEDLASQNGTLVNGAKISALTPLKTGDAIALGTVLVGFAEVGGAPPRVKLTPQGQPSASRRLTGEVLMQGMPARKQVPGRSKDGEEVATASGEGGPLPSYDVGDTEHTAPSGVALVPTDEGTSPDRKPLVALKGAQLGYGAQGSGAGDETNVGLPAVDDDEGPASLQPGTPAPGQGARERDLSTAIGRAPSGPGPERPSLPERAPVPERSSGSAERPAGLARGSGPQVLVPRPSAPREPKALSSPGGAVPVGRGNVSGQVVIPGGPAPRASEPVLVPRPSAPRPGPPQEAQTGPRMADDQKTALKASPYEAMATPYENVETVARAPVVPEVTPIEPRKAIEHTRIASVGPPSSAAAKEISQTRPVVPTVPAPQESAADRARRKREATKSVWLMLAFQWSVLPKKVQALAAAGAGALVLGLGVALALGTDEGKRAPAGPEPQVLSTTDEVEASFGFGLEVDFERRDSKTFKYSLNAPTDAAVVVHLRGQGIGHEELAVSSNGNDVGFVPEDMAVPNRDLQVLVPPRALLKGAENVITFENRRAASQDTWRISNLKLEVIAIPPQTREGQALEEARRLLKQAQGHLETKEVATSNLYRAWKLYRDVWVVLLALPEDARTSLYSDARFKHAELGRELDQRCGASLLEAKKQMELKNPDRAKVILDDIPTHFPGKEHPCQNLALAKSAEYEL